MELQVRAPSPSPSLRLANITRRCLNNLRPSPLLARVVVFHESTPPGRSDTSRLLLPYTTTSATLWVPTSSNLSANVVTVAQDSIAPGHGVSWIRGSRTRGYQQACTLHCPTPISACNFVSTMRSPAAPQYNTIGCTNGRNFVGTIYGMVTAFLSRPIHLPLPYIYKPCAACFGRPSPCPRCESAHFASAAARSPPWWLRSTHRNGASCLRGNSQSAEPVSTLTRALEPPHVCLFL